MGVLYELVNMYIALWMLPEKGCRGRKGRKESSSSTERKKKEKKKSVT